MTLDLRITSFISSQTSNSLLLNCLFPYKMSKLDFSHKYRITDAEDEINNLGKSINTMSDKLENTIKQLRETNIESSFALNIKKVIPFVVSSIFLTNILSFLNTIFFLFLRILWFVGIYILL